jgi:hypothetical protein
MNWGLGAGFGAVDSVSVGSGGKLVGVALGMGAILGRSGLKGIAIAVVAQVKATKLTKPMLANPTNPYNAGRFTDITPTDMILLASLAETLLLW